MKKEDIALSNSIAGNDSVWVELSVKSCYWNNIFSGVLKYIIDNNYLSIDMVLALYSFFSSHINRLHF
ncbi:hypothetical protein [Xenorhabdus littoralis]|uniref:hypothetical protein n=1 Tax=Xenorhabdus littoralis TaxID=2582835 RepID=UPI0029E81A71|nr:hypothetical protein [Xenorhabdus sp. psl]